MRGVRTLLRCIEVCIDTIQTAIAAANVGANRLELCAALDVGGVTPSAAMVEAVLKRVHCPVIALIRPRTGNFIYDALDIEQTLASVWELSRKPVSGLAVGGLTRDGQLDLSLLRAVGEVCGSASQLVMHRAFDFVADPRTALDQLVDLGYRRVLTSGGATGPAVAHLDRLRELVCHARGRIEILPGGGIDASNAVSLLSGTGCDQLHGSFRQTRQASGADRTGFGSQAELDLDGLRTLVNLRDQVP